MTTGEIFVAVALKGALFAILHKLGWLPDPIEYNTMKRQERLMLKSYKRWRKEAGPEAAAKLHATLEASAPVSWWYKAMGRSKAG